METSRTRLRNGTLHRLITMPRHEFSDSDFSGSGDSGFEESDFGDRRGVLGDILCCEGQLMVKRYCEEEAHFQKDYIPSESEESQSA